MKVTLCSNNFDHISYWEKHLKKIEFSIVTCEELLLIENCIIILYETACSHEHLELICKKNKVLLLSEIIHFKKFQFYFRQGILGYGNVYMQEFFLLSALNTIENGDVWIAPKLNRELILSLKDLKDQKLSESFNTILTPKEIIIAKLILEGHTNIFIAKKVNISINTLKSHIRNIYNKLELKDRFEFLKYYQESTLTPKGD